MPKKGYKQTEATKRKISKSLSGKNNLFYGITRSEEHKRKISEANRGRTYSEETKRKISEAQKGKIISEETKQKISETNKGKLVSEESRRKASATKQGILLSEWNGYANEKPYCHKFNESLRISIREKYNNCDYMSGLNNKICNNNKKLSVHHVNYDKNCGCNGIKCKLIPLSVSNHTKTNANRHFWNKLFIYALSIDEWYYTNTP